MIDQPQDGSNASSGVPSIRSKFDALKAELENLPSLECGLHSLSYAADLIQFGAYSVARKNSGNQVAGLILAAAEVERYGKMLEDQIAAENKPKQ